MSRFLLFILLALIVAPSAEAGEQVHVFMRAENRKMTRKECARIVVEALGIREKFPIAEANKEGNVQGWNSEMAVQVLTYPTPDPDRVWFVAIAAGSDKVETNRVLQSVVEHIMSGRGNPDTPARIAMFDEKIPQRPFTIICKSEEQGATPILRHFGPAATIVLEKKGYQTTPISTDFIGGVLPGGPEQHRSALLFVAPTTRTTSARLCVAYATSGEEAGENAADDLLTQLVKILYE